MTKEEKISGSLDPGQFEMLFRQYFNQLVAYALKYTKDLDTSKEIVHNIFVTVWEKRNTIRQDLNLRSYLYTSVYNRCLNYLRDTKKTIDIDEMTENPAFSNPENMELIELEEKVRSGIMSLPEKCREIFILSRYEELKYKEISEKLGISVKTVEAQMSKALKMLRMHLKEFLAIIIILLLFK